MGRFTGILGLLAMIGLAYAFSTNRRAIRLKTVAWGLGSADRFRDLCAEGRIRSSTFRGRGQRGKSPIELLLRRLQVRIRRAGEARLFDGVLLRLSGAAHHHLHRRVFRTPVSLSASCSSSSSKWPRVMTHVMGASGAESLNVAASIFMGQTEAPLTIRPFLPASPLRTDDRHDQRHGPCLRRNHGGVYRVRHRAASICLSAVIMTAPGTLLMAKMLVPETEQPRPRAAS